MLTAPPVEGWSLCYAAVPPRVDLVAVMGWASRRVLSWRLSNKMDADFCVAALEEAIACYGVPEIFNTDQGSQFTSFVFTDVLKANGIRISMDGKDRWMDRLRHRRMHCVRHSSKLLRKERRVAGHGDSGKVGQQSACDCLS